MIPLTIWMNIPSHHQQPLFKSLTATADVDLEVIFAHRMSPDRKVLGWQSDLGGFSHRFLDPKLSHLDAVSLAWKQRNRFHIFGGVWAESAFTTALLLLSMTGNRYAIYSEARIIPKPHATHKQLLKSVVGRWLIRRATGALMVSQMATDYYKQYGLGEEKVYPFGYFHSEAPNSPIDVTTRRDKIELVFVGQLVHRKGIDLLIKAIRNLSSAYPDLRLRVIGEGVKRREYEELARGLNVSFEGAIPSGEVIDNIKCADLLVLPSRFDGWGIVVNEAFSVGVPVIASDRCGASELISEGQNGYIFKSEDVADLDNKLREFLSQQERWSEFKAAAAHNGKRIATETVTPYLVNCIEHMLGMREKKPVPPWKEA